MTSDSKVAGGVEAQRNAGRMLAVTPIEEVVAQSGVKGPAARVDSTWLAANGKELLAGAGLVGLTVLAYARFLSVGFAATDSLPLIETSRFSSVDGALQLFTRPVMS